ncbi:unnamed protein product [Rhizoctonia solani]|uniref:Uncharacterized protein n=1 Tax=Rhizoctonia solani TaxID=456999 RepID=A0A8H3HZN1_9AGAM|nr:unnamed protein product [Rhizoctonia solani]
MITVWVALTLLVAQSSAKAVKRQTPEHELFLSLNGRGDDTVSVSQCDEVQVSFAGGFPPYMLGVWSEDQQTFISAVSMESAGDTIWSVQSSPTKLSLNLRDSAGRSATSQLVDVLPGTKSCYGSIPVLRKGNLPSNKLEGPTNLAARPGSLQDCRRGGPATCKFSQKQSKSGIIIDTQQALMGNIFSNCHSNQPVKQKFSGSVTLSDGWSARTGPTFITPMGTLELVVETTVMHGESRAVEQSFEWEIPPGTQVSKVSKAYSCMLIQMDESDCPRCKSEVQWDLRRNGYELLQRHQNPDHRCDIFSEHRREGDSHESGYNVRGELANLECDVNN